MTSAVQIPIVLDPIMVGEVDTVSPTFSFFRGSLFWVGGFTLIFLVIVVMISLFDSPNSTATGRTGLGVPTRPTGSGGDAEASMGLTPETAAPPEQK